METNLTELERRIGYSFKDKTLLVKALTHSSYANEKKLGKGGCNERLEFLGDAVLELISSHFLFEKYPKLPEGELTKKRASLVCEPSLAFCARDFELPKYLLLGRGEELHQEDGTGILLSQMQQRLFLGLFIWTVVLLMQRSLYWILY